MTVSKISYSLSIFFAVSVMVIHCPLVHSQCKFDADCTSLGNDTKCYAEADGGPRKGKCDCTIPIKTSERDCYCIINGQTRVRWVQNSKQECRLVGREICEKKEKESSDSHLKCSDYHECKKKGNKKYGICTRNRAGFTVDFSATAMLSVLGGLMYSLLVVFDLNLHK